MASIEFSQREGFDAIQAYAKIRSGASLSQITSAYEKEYENAKEIKDLEKIQKIMKQAIAGKQEYYTKTIVGWIKFNLLTIYCTLSDRNYRKDHQLPSIRKSQALIDKLQSSIEEKNKERNPT
jgi:hypothetical protein